MAQFVYIDETGSVGTAAAGQPYLTLVAVMVDESQVGPLGEEMRRVAFKHLGWFPQDFEFHGHEIWGGVNWWEDKAPPELIAAYEAVLSLLDQFDLGIAHASVHKAGLRARYDGAFDDSAYRLALQFLLEKVDRLGQQLRIVVADETKEQELRAIEMVADMQRWGVGAVPGQELKTIIDCLHFVRSNASPGVQMADLVAFVIQRARRNREGHPDAKAAMERLRANVEAHTLTWREPWP